MSQASVWPSHREFLLLKCLQKSMTVASFTCASDTSKDLLILEFPFKD